MKGKKSTRSAFLTSLMSLVLCFAMLLGTTLAWFTDTATTGVNTITAGNLDIDVTYWDGGSWEPIQDEDSLFSNDLWEPGHTEYVKLKIENAGTLDLNYKVLVTPVSERGGVNVNGQSFKLSDYLVFGTTAPSTTNPDYNRDSARAAIGNSTSMGLDVNALTQTGTMVGKTAAATDVQYLALVVYMPETVGNEANYKTGTTAPKIELGIKVVATQMEAELDSFGPDYDAGATTGAPEYVVGPTYDYFPQVMASEPVVRDASGAVTSATTITANGKLNSTDTTETQLAQVTVPAGAVAEDATELTVKVVPKEPEATTTSGTALVTEINDPNRETANFDIKVEGIASTNSEPITVEVFVGKGLANVKVYHNGTLIPDTSYDPTTGKVSFSTTSFSDFTAAYDVAVAAIGTKTYGSLKNAVAAAKDNDTILLLKDAKVTETVTVSKNVTLNLAGNAITGDGVRAIHVKGDTLKLAGSGTVSSTVGNVGSSVIRVGSDEAAAAGLVVEKGITISTATAYGITVFGATSESVMISGTVTSTAPENTSYDGCAISTLGTDTTAATITINDGATISAANTNAIYMPSGNLTVKGGTITGRTGIYVKSGNTTISGGTITGNGPAVAYGYYGNGGISTGDALVVDSCGYPNGKPVVVVRGGTFLSTNAKAVASYNKEGNELVTGFIKKGTFSSDPTALMASGYKATQNGQQYSVSKTAETLTGIAWHELDALTGDFYYDGEGVVTVKDYQEFNFSGNANITIKDVIFENGLTIYTNDVNASGTVTLEDCVICLHDGTPNPGSNYGLNRRKDCGLVLGANASGVSYVFKNCKFTAKADHQYGNDTYSTNVYVSGNYSADSITFDGCTFEKSGKHGINNAYGANGTGYNFTVTNCNFKNWQNNSTLSTFNGAAIRGDFSNKNITISGNTFGKATFGTTTAVNIGGWNGSWS